MNEDVDYCLNTPLAGILAAHTILSDLVQSFFIVW
jgi:hypothetical protein